MELTHWHNVFFVSYFFFSNMIFLNIIFGFVVEVSVGIIGQTKSKMEAEEEE